MPNQLPEILEGRSIPLPVGRPGFDLPVMEGLNRINFNQLNSLPNCTVEGSTEFESNIAFIPEDFRPTHPIRIKLSSHTRNTLLIIGTGSKVFGQLRFNGPGHTVILAGADEGGTAQNVELNGTSNCFFLGKGSSSNGLTSHIVGEGISVCVGEHLLSAHEVRILTSDMHALIDATSGNIINPAKSVHIDPHVWLAENSTVLKGCRIGFGSVLGLGSILTKGIPARCIAAGVPARVIRENTTWLAHSGPDPRLLRKLRDLEARIAM